MFVYVFTSSFKKPIFLESTPLNLISSVVFSTILKQRWLIAVLNTRLSVVEHICCFTRSRKLHNTKNSCKFFSSTQISEKKNNQISTTFNMFSFLTIRVFAHNSYFIFLFLRLSNDTFGVEYICVNMS